MEIKLANNIKVIRKLRKITQKEMSEKLNIGRTFFTGIENGYYYPNIKIILKIAFILDVSLDHLFSINESIIEELEGDYDLSEYQCVAFVDEETKKEVSYQEMKKIIEEQPEAINKYSVKGKAPLTKS